MDWKQILATGVMLALLVGPVSYCETKTTESKVGFEKACLEKGWVINRRNDCVRP